MSRGGKVIRFIEKFCLVPEGAKVGRPLKLKEFQKRFILEVYDNEAGTSRAYLSMARKNGKSALIAAIALAHVVGPEAKLNSQVISGARSRDQASIIFHLAEKMVRLNPELHKLIRIIPSLKKLVGLAMNVEYRAISAEAGTAHGLSPIVAILDEVGQVKGPVDPFVEAIETAQGAHENPLLLAISTQAPTDADMFSVWLDDAAASHDPRIVSHVYTAPEDCALDDREAWAAANPALGDFRSLRDIEDFAERAQRQPASENSFRWLYLNQRIEAFSPFISRSLWTDCKGKVEAFDGLPVYAGLDLSSTADLTALVLLAPHNGKWHVRPTFWLPGEGLREKSQKDRVPYDQWAKDKLLQTTPGRAIEYEFIAEYLRGLFDSHDVRKIAFDRWGWEHMRPWLVKAGFSDAEIEKFEPFGQGYKSMTPALRDLEAAILQDRLVHDGHPVLSMCMGNAVVQTDPAGNRKLAKNKSHGRIDGAVALVMSMAVASTHEEQRKPEYQMLFV